jgi:L-lactate dehydrogenase complex protein LldE
MGLAHMRVALFVTCFNDALYPGTGKAVVRLLERLGHEVVFPAEQTCCGQMHVKHRLLPRGRAAGPPVPQGLRPVPGDRVASPSCVGTVRESYARIAERTSDQALARSASRIVPWVNELSEFLVDVLGVQLVLLQMAQVGQYLLTLVAVQLPAGAHHRRDKIATEITRQPSPPE